MLRVSVAVCLLFCIEMQCSQAATVRKIVDAREFSVGSVHCTLELTGEITEGDLKQFQNIADDRRVGAELLCLNSLGGSYDEALSLARYLFDHGIGTAIKGDKECFSACALIFMAGSEWTENVTQPARYLDVRGQLGFHAPYIDGTNGAVSIETAARAYEAGTTAIGKLLDILLRSHTPEKQDVLPLPLLAQMLRKGSSESYNIDTIKKVIESRITLMGVGKLMNTSRQMVCNACSAVHPYFPFSEVCDEDPSRHYEEKTMGDSSSFEIGIIGIEEGAAFVCKVEQKKDGVIKYEIVDVAGQTFQRGIMGAWYFLPPSTLLKELPR